MSEGDTELIRRAPAERPPLVSTPAVGGEGWWARVLGSLGDFTERAIQVLDLDSEYAVTGIAPRNGTLLRQEAWPETRVRTGIVVGSVQSGKTANMLAVAAKALDRGVGLIVILAGTRIALWLQTYERVLEQLDGTTRTTSYKRDRTRLLIPSPNDVLGSTVRADAYQYLRAHERRLAAAVSKGNPVIIVVPKEDDHLAELAGLLHETLSPAVLNSRASPLEMLVMDDEADDGSILSSEDSDKVTPSYIRNLWSNNHRPSHTFHPRLFATYVAYTATPQANFLQDSHNPLSPRHFQIALRVPGERGDVVHRETTFAEPRGVAKYYTGGHLYYERGGAKSGLIVRLAPPVRGGFTNDAEFEEAFRAFQLESLGESLRAYLVAGAIRLCLAGRRLSDVAPGAILTAEEMRARLPSWHCMLIHPSSQMDVHFAVADDVRRWAASLPGAEEETDSESLGPGLSVDGLRARLLAEEPRWMTWLQSYQASERALETLPGSVDSGLRKLSWDTVRECLWDQVFPHVNLRVLNSDEDASERPRFRKMPIEDRPGLFEPPSDIYSIFVAGNVLSRGLTIEGLATSLFVRSSKTPVADTQMQMQRWFGYRGAYLSLCRIFLYPEQVDLFADYHANDETLKTEILRRMTTVPSLSPEDAFLVLEGETHRATAKVDARKVPLHPGPTPSIKLVEFANPDFVETNTKVFLDSLSEGTWESLIVGGDAKGLIRREPISMASVAAMLDSLRYSEHSPLASDPMYARWASLAATWHLPTLLNLPKSTGEHRVSSEPSGCPYSIAAYLRLWDALLETPGAMAFRPTDRLHTRWHLLNLKEYRETRPVFYVGVRFGDAGAAHDSRLRALGVRPMIRGFHGSKVDVLWGSRGGEGEYLGDQYFDYHLHQTAPIPRLHQDSAWRRRGHPGQILFHVVKGPAPGTDMVTVGLALPHGGPDQIAALR